MKRFWSLAAGSLLLLSAGRAPAQAPTSAAPVADGASITAPSQVRAVDTPDDKGGSITVSWQAGPGAARYIIERAEGEAEFDSVDAASGNATSYEDGDVHDGKPYRYKIVAVGATGERAGSDASAPAISSPQWFNGNLLGVLIGIVIFAGLVLFFVRQARAGIQLFIRRIGGLEAVDEAVGRATEMGRPLLYVPGTGYISDIATIAALNLLGEIAKKTAAYGTTLRAPVRDPIVYTVAREVVQGAYVAAGRPDSYDPESVSFLVENGLAYAGGVSGMMVREKPAANFFMGPFGGESLILSESGSTTGAIQIAGCDDTTQLPFFVVACDYTLIGEELYAASAYISREPLMLGALKGQDYSKFIILAILVLGTAISLIFSADVGKVLFSTGAR